MTTEIGGVETLAKFNAVGYVGQRGPAWWGHGMLRTEFNHFDGPVPMWRVDELLAQSRVEETPIYVQDAHGNFVALEDRKAIRTVSTGTVQGIFKGGYATHQGRTLMDIVAPLLGGSVDVGSIGVLKQGALVYISLEVPESISISKYGETFRPHLLVVTSFDGSLATTVRRAITRAVCDNTVSAGLAEAGLKLKFKHTKYSLSSLKTAHEALGLIERTADAYIDEMSTLIETTVTDAMWSKFLDAHASLTDPKTKERKKGASLTLATNERESLTQLWNADPRVSPWKNTAWGVLQAVNTYTHHVGIVRNMNRTERNLMRGVTGGVDDLDKGTMKTLEKVLLSV